MNLRRSLILASESPRRKELLEAAGYQFEVRKAGTNEDFRSDQAPEDVAIHLARKKAKALSRFWTSHIVLAADTIVVLRGQVLGKPSGRPDAIRMLRALSGREHQVITGVSINTDHREESFADLTRVWFDPLSLEDIEYYVDNYKPWDKAGAYGIQDWIGMTGINKIEGSYFNVVGLPIHLVHAKLKGF